MILALALVLLAQTVTATLLFFFGIGVDAGPVGRVSNLGKTAYMQAGITYSLLLAVVGAAFYVAGESKPR